MAGVAGPGIALFSSRRKIGFLGQPTGWSLFVKPRRIKEGGEEVGVFCVTNQHGSPTIRRFDMEKGRPSLSRMDALITGSGKTSVLQSLWMILLQGPRRAMRICTGCRELCGDI